MKILFIYTDVSIAIGYTAGIGSLSAFLKREGHEVQLIHVSKELDYPLDLERIIKDIGVIKPDLICFSITTNQWYYSRRIGDCIKKTFNIPIIVGGHHPTSDPDNVLSESWVDLLCQGEGEHTLLEVVRRIEDGRSMDGVPNLLHKKNGKVIKELMKEWEGDIDALPFDDRDIFDYEKIVETRGGWAEVIVTRGCPFACTYCFNKPLIDRYKNEVNTDNKNKSFSVSEFTNRRRSVDATIRMLKELKEKYNNITAFTFVDDIMAKVGDWIDEFTSRYKEEIGLPYACTSQPLYFNEILAKQLKESGCKVVKMGIEVGNEAIRKKVLKRNISNECLINVFKIAKDYGLKPQSFNMIGVPGESVDNLMETVRLNAIMKPYIVSASTFFPYPGTELYNKCLKNGMIDLVKLDQVDSYRSESVLKEEILPSIEFKKFRILFRWLLNASLKNSAEMIFRKNIDELRSFSNAKWLDDTAEKIFLERDSEIDLELRKKDISHYVSKKYINIFWGKEYNYDLS
jgi:radical SAM superfamily enzyme YgiQ (UPF0313 family)